MKGIQKICLFEIALIVLGIVSYSWIAGGYANIFPELPKKEKVVNLLNYLDLLNIIPEVSALGLEELIGNALRGDNLENEKVGCSFDKEEGLCTPHSLKSQCDESESCEWFENVECEIPQCQMGCCTIGLNRQYITQRRCEKLGRLYGTPTSFNLGIDEKECILSAEDEESGACVFLNSELDERNCKFTSSRDCSSSGGEFYSGYLCSNPQLNTSCQRQKSIGCVEGRDEIYWFDSCGNRENIYSSDKERSWNNGRVLSKEESCNPDSNNAESSTCGNCNYELGSLCRKYEAGVDRVKVRDGEYVCRDLNCRNAPGHAGIKKDRVNGESWCVYDGQIGNVGIGPIGVLSADVVGSRHFRYICNNGKVEVEPCADYRKEICVEKTSNSRSEALCRVNMYEHCLSANGGLGAMISQLLGGGQGGCEGECLAKCATNPDCRIHPVYVDSDFRFSMCVPKYPPGFELGEGSLISGIASNFFGNVGEFGEMANQLVSQAGSLNGGGGASEICGMGSRTCIVLYKKFCPGGWKCIKNCNCMEATFTIQMNNLCVSLGDCGVYTNIVGTVMSVMGASVSKKGKHGHAPPSPMLLSPFYSIFAFPIPFQRADPGFFDSVQGLAQLPIMGIGNIFGTLSSINGGGDLGGQLSNMFSGSQLGWSAGLGLGAGLIGAGAYLTASGFALGAGTIGGAYHIGVLSLGVKGLGASWLGLVGWAVASALAAIAIMYLMGCGKVEKVEIKFECKPWQRPPLALGGGSFIGNLNNEGELSAGRNRLDNLEPEEYVQNGNNPIENIFQQIGNFLNNIFENVLGGRGIFGIGAGCDFCQRDPLKPCTRYRCESIGMNCRIINEDTNEAKCITVSESNARPRISPLREVLTEGYRYEDESENGFKVRTKDGECVQAFTPIIFGVKTDIYANCKWSLERKDYLSMENEFFEGRRFSKNHTLITTMPSVESLIADETSDINEFNILIANETLYSSLLNRAGDLNIYVKCASPEGNTNDQDYRINICISPGPDLTPPIIIGMTPPIEHTVAINLTSQKAIFLLNEPADCKWDTIRPTSYGLEGYNSLRNNMDCERSLSSETLLGFPCRAELPILSNDNYYYIMCRDQPWLGENESRNIGNVEEYRLKRTQNELKIIEISPNGKIIRGKEPIEATIIAKTSGGVDDGAAICWLKLNEYGEIRFYETGNKTHRQIFSSLLRGNYTLNVRCLDRVGNAAANSTSLSIEVDNIAPQITRIYKRGNDLVVITNEDSICYYDFENSLCNFNYENVRKMSTDYTIYHTAEWDNNKIYYIKCIDKFDNKIDGCSIIARPSTIISIY